MANVKLIFQGTENSKTDSSQLLCYKNINEEIFIEIKMPNDYPSFICLDKVTAIRLHRELKKNISFINEEEVQDGTR
jgi:hypothetical protein